MTLLLLLLAVLTATVARLLLAAAAPAMLQLLRLLLQVFPTAAKLLAAAVPAAERELLLTWQLLLDKLWLADVVSARLFRDVESDVPDTLGVPDVRLEARGVRVDVDEMATAAMAWLRPLRPTGDNCGGLTGSVFSFPPDGAAQI